MSFESQTSELVFNTDGVSVSFPLLNGGGALYFMQGSDIRAAFKSAAGAEEDLTYIADYSVVGDGRTGNGELKTEHPLESGGKLKVWCATPIVQPEQYEENDSFPAATHESAQDRGRMIDRDLQRQIKLCIRAPDSDGPLNMVLSPKAQRASKAVAFDADGELTTENADANAAAASAVEAGEARDEAVAAAAAIQSTMWALVPNKGRLKTPLPDPVSGDVCLVWRVDTAGVFVGRENQIARFNGNSWDFSGPPSPGQTIAMDGEILMWQLGIEEDAANGVYYWRTLNRDLAVICEGGKLITTGDSLAKTPDDTQSAPNRFCNNWGLVHDNTAVSGTGFFSATWKLFQKPTLDPRKGHNYFNIQTGHNTALSGSTPERIKLKAFHQTFNMLAHAFGDLTPASALTPTVGHVWTPNTGDALGLKDLAFLSGAGTAMYATAPDQQLNGNFSGENFIVLTTRGDGLVDGNRCADWKPVIDGSSRPFYVDDGLWEINNDGVHMGHAGYIDNKWGVGTRAFTIVSGANTTPARPCYIVGAINLRPPTLCLPVLLHDVLRPTDLKPTTTLSLGTATEVNFRAAREGMLLACSYFPGYPIHWIYPNEWMDAPADMPDKEHPTGGTSIKYTRAMTARCKRGTFHASGTYAPVAGGKVNVSGDPVMACSYEINGKEGSVHFNLSVTAIADATDTGFTIPLPPGFESDFTSGEDCNGVGATHTGVQQTLAVKAKTDDNKPWFLWHNTAGTGAVSFSGSFKFRIKP